MEAYSKKRKNKSLRIKVCYGIYFDRIFSLKYILNAENEQ